MDAHNTKNTQSTGSVDSLANNATIHLTQRRPPTPLILLLSTHAYPRNTPLASLHSLSTTARCAADLISILTGNGLGPVRKPFVHAVSTASSMSSTVSWAPVERYVPGVMEKAQTSLAMLMIYGRCLRLVG